MASSKKHACCNGTAGCRGRGEKHACGLIDAEFREEPWAPGAGCFPPPGEPGSRFNADGSPRPQEGPPPPYNPYDKSPEVIEAYQKGLEEAMRYFNSIPPVPAAPPGAPWGVIASSAVGSALGGLLYHVTGSNPHFLAEYVKVVRPQLEHLFGNPTLDDVVHFLLEKGKKNDGYISAKELAAEIKRGAHVGAADRAHARAVQRRRAPKRKKKSKKNPSKETP